MMMIWQLRQVICTPGLFFLLLWAIMASAENSINESDGKNSTERAALQSLISSFVNDGVLRSNWSGPQICVQKNQSQWMGVVCSEWRIISLILDNLGLAGSIPGKALLELTEIRRLSFRNNSLGGILPDLSTLRNLELCYFSGNRFLGSIPHSYFKDLKALKNLALDDNHLNGSIPSSLVNLNQMREIQLQNNNLTGGIPPFDQPSLKIFNVSNNRLAGPIPGTAILQSFGSDSFLGNPGLCGKPLNYNNPCTANRPPSMAESATVPQHPATEKPRARKTATTIIAVVVPSITALLIAAMVFFRNCRGSRLKKATTASHSAGISDTGRDLRQDSSNSAEIGISRHKFNAKRRKLVFLTSDQPVFCLDDLLCSSAELLGEGGFGAAYKTVLASGSTVVVKRLGGPNGLGMKKFQRQMQLLGKLRHRNLVPLTSYYYSDEGTLLVYEYMPNGNLLELLHGNRGPGRVPLDGKFRLRIARGVARGLAYLHHQCQNQKISHGNLKSSNVLLGEDYEPRLSDYGLEPVIGRNIAAAQGMMAYRAPEYVLSKKLSPKADIWSFGILVLELLTGKLHAISVAQNQMAVDLPQWVRSVPTEEWAAEIFDLEIGVSSTSEGEMLLKMLQIALSCADESPAKRPQMSELLKITEEFGESDSPDQHRFSTTPASDQTDTSHHSSLPITR